MNAIEDSVCTNELHDTVMTWEKAASGARQLGQHDDNARFQTYAGIVSQIERVSRRIDGEAAARLALASIVGEALDILSHVSGSPSMDRLKELGDLLKLAP